MKIRIEMDMTPDEARRTMGLPDVSGMQDKLVAQMEKRLLAALDTSDPQAMLKSWFPLGSQGLGAVPEIHVGQRPAGRERGSVPQGQSLPLSGPE